MKRQPAWVWVVLGLGFCGWGCVGLLGLASLSARTVQTQPQKRTWTRQEFEAMVVGKTKDEVLSLAGKPDSTSTSTPFEYWTYMGSTRDEFGSVDFMATVSFKNGSVDYVSFH